MEKTRWQRIEELFEKALLIDPALRLKFLEEEVGNDRELLNEIVSLLAADEQNHSIFDAPFIEDFITDLSEKYIGKNIGNYKIVKEIGSGGMGAVFLGERNDGVFSRQAAIKITKTFNSTPDIIKRFQSERQILARLKHPNIASLYDGGITEEGLPYFSMEYVEGEPIDEYCSKNKLSPKEIAKIFIDVCEALQYAHQNLIVHRDIKPSNIFITGEGKVKLLDFGIAKVFSENEEALTESFTRTGMYLLTPEYASPEQIRGEAATTAADIYSLGLTLYKSLIGALPYDAKGKTGLDLERIVCTTEAIKPSSQLSRIIRKKENLPADQRLELTKLRRKIRGDLDNICLKALMKEPENRYRSVEQLKVDLLSYTKNLPISARAPSLSYRASKFFARNKIVTIAASVFILVTVSLTLFYLATITRERDKARLEAEKANRVTEFMTEIFKVASPSESRGETVTAREILENGSKKIDQELAGQPEIKQKLLSAIGGAYFSLGLMGEAERLLTESLEINNRLGSDYLLESADDLTGLGDVYRIVGKFDKADSVLKESLKIYSDKGETASKKYAWALQLLATNQIYLGEYSSCDSMYSVSIETFRHIGLERDEYYLTTLNNYALFLHEQGEFKRSEKIFKEAYEKQLDVYGEKPHPELATTLYNFGQLYRDMGKFVEAEKMLTKSLEYDRILNEGDHPDIAYSLQGLSIIYRLRGDYEKALSYNKEAYQIRKKFFGEENPNTAYSVYSTGQIFLDARQYDSALVYVDKAYKMQLKIFGKDNPRMANIIDKLGQIEIGRENFTKAESYIRRSLELNEKSLGDLHLATQRDYYNLARIRSAQKKYDEAIRITEECLPKIAEVAGGKENQSYAMTQLFLSEVLSEKGDYLRADSLYKENFEIFNSIFSDNDLNQGRIFLSFAAHLIRKGRPEEAIKYAEDAKKVFQKTYSINNFQITRANLTLADAYLSSGNQSTGAKLLKESYKKLKEEFGENFKWTRKAKEKMIAFNVTQH